MKEANLIIGRKGQYKNLSIDESQKILKDTDDHIFSRDIQYDEFGDPIKRDPDDFASGGLARVGMAIGGFTKLEVLIQILKNTIKGSKDSYVTKTFPKWIKELQKNPKLALNKDVWKELTGGLPKNQRLVVHSDDSVDFFTQSKFGPHNIEKTLEFQKKHNLSRDQANKILRMDPEDRVLEMKKLETIGNKKLENQMDYPLSPEEIKGKKLADSMSDAEIELRGEFPGITDEMINNILTDKNPQRIAEVKQTMREAFKMQEKGMSPDEIIKTFEDTSRTKQASGGLQTLNRPGYASGTKKKKKEEAIINPNYVPSTLEEMINAIDIKPRASGSFTEGPYGPKNEQRTWSDVIGGEATVDLPWGFELKGDYDKFRIKDRLYSSDDEYLDERVDADHDRWKLELLWKKKFGKGAKKLNQGGRAGSGLNYLLGEDDQNVRMPYGGLPGLLGE